MLDSLERLDDPTQAFVQNVNERAAEIAADAEATQAKLRELRSTAPEHPCPELLDQLPAGAIDLERVPEPVLRRMLDVFRLRMRYDRETSQVEREVTITSEIVDLQRDAAATAIRATRPEPSAGLRSPYGIRRRPGLVPTPPNAPPNHPVPLHNPVTGWLRVPE